MSETIILPRLNGTRDAAKALIKRALGDARSEAQAGRDVTVNARAVTSAAPSFVDALIDDLADRGIAKVHLVGASQKLLERTQEAARRQLQTKGKRVEIDTLVLTA